METRDRFVPLELDRVASGEPPRHLGWVVATIAICAAMVLLAAGLVPLALAAGSPARASEATASVSTARTSAVPAPLSAP